MRSCLRIALPMITPFSSAKDRMGTHRLNRAGEHLGISYLDHCMGGVLRCLLTKLLSSKASF